MDRRAKIEFGDFQTPPSLAVAVCARLRSENCQPKTILEPTCGLGSFLMAASDAFPDATRIVGLDINADYVAQVASDTSSRCDKGRFDLRCQDVFSLADRSPLEGLPEPWLVIGNPPWVTNAGLGVLQSRNLPKKTNDDRCRGIDAMTGAANFDICEWILRRAMLWLDGHMGTLAMLCKTSVARRLLSFAFGRELRMSKACVIGIDAQAEFQASVDACLLVCEFDRLVDQDATSSTASQRAVACYCSLKARAPAQHWGWFDGCLLADANRFETCRHLHAAERLSRNWRSGVKHDGADVFELREVNGEFLNGLGEVVDIEPDCLYPLLKSTDLARGQLVPRRWLVTPQRSLQDDTSQLEQRAPRTWGYLNRHADRLNRRRSRIYRGKPPFAIFGIGEYSFARWKVAISGLHKTLRFTCLGPLGDQAILLDDACYFLPCESEQQARALTAALHSAEVRDFFTAFLFQDAKRPITAQLLERLDVRRLLRESATS